MRDFEKSTDELASSPAPQNLKFERSDWTSFRTAEPMTLRNMRANGVRSLES